MTNLSPSNRSCVICLDSITYQGSLSVCKHSFCFECILEWSKVDNTCPLCKSKFRCIRRVGLFAGASPMSRVRVADRQQRVWYDDEDVAGADFEGYSQNPELEPTDEFGEWITSQRHADGYDLNDPFIDDTDASQSTSLWTLLTENDPDYDWRSTLQPRRQQRRPRRQPTLRSYTRQAHRQTNHSSEDQHQEAQPAGFYGRRAVNGGQQTVERLHQTDGAVGDMAGNSSGRRGGDSSIVQSWGAGRRRKRKASVRRGVKPVVARYLDELSGSGREVTSSGSSSCMAADGEERSHNLDDVSTATGKCRSTRQDFSDSDFEPLSVRVRKIPKDVPGTVGEELACQRKKRNNSSQSTTHASNSHASTVHGHLTEQQTSTAFDTEDTVEDQSTSTRSHQPKNPTRLLDALQAASPPSTRHACLPIWAAASNPFSITQRQDQENNGTPFTWTPNTATRKRKAFFAGRARIAARQPLGRLTPTVETVREKRLSALAPDITQTSLMLKHGTVIVSDTDGESD